MPKYAIDDLTTHDVETKSVFELDRQFYPPHLIWSRDLWLGLIEAPDSIVKKAIRLADEPDSMIGNVIVVIDGDRRTNYEKPCFLVYTITIAKEHQRQGLAMRLFCEVSETIARKQAAGEYSDIETIDLSLEKTDEAARCFYEKCGFVEYTFEGARNYKIYMQQSVDSFHKHMALLSTSEQYQKQSVQFLDNKPFIHDDLSEAFGALLATDAKLPLVPSTGGAAVDPLVFTRVSVNDLQPVPEQPYDSNKP